MIGLVLAAGTGTRLRPHTDNLPKTLLPVDGERTLLDTILSNLRAVAIGEVAIVVGHASAAMEDALPNLKERHQLDITLVYNDRPEWNNAYSLWLARDHYATGALLVNGDTLHPVCVEQALLSAPGEGLLITVDSRKALTDEAMKVRLDDVGAVVRLSKRLPISQSFGEYLGASLISSAEAAQITAALEATWRADPSLYYEDGFQLYADRGGRIVPVDPGPIEWVEVDDHADLALARELACRS